MIKKYVILLIIILFSTGCTKEKIILDDSLYNTNEFISITEVETIDGNYILYTYNGYCSFAKPCEEIFQEFMSEYNIGMYSINFSDFKNTWIYDTVKYAPSVIIVSNNKIIAYLDANSDDDLDKYQDVDEFAKWVLEYVNEEY